MDSSLSTLDHDEPIIPPHHVIVCGAAYFLDGCLCRTPCDGPDHLPRWEDNASEEVDPGWPSYDAMVDLLAATKPEPVRFTAERIGALDAPDGADFYYRLKVTGDYPATVEAMHNAFLPTVYFEPSGPGSQFCTRASVIPVPDSGGREFIGVAQSRFDV